VVICMGLMEYLDDEARVLSEISRIVRQKGLVIITLPNLHSPYRQWHRLLNSAFNYLGRLFPKNQKLQHVEFMVGPFTKGVKHREYDRWSYGKVLQKHGLQPVEVRYYNFKLFLTPFDKWFPELTVRVSKVLEKLWWYPIGQFMATAFIIKARKTG
jgi:SAM-dependent methyltransferase